MLASLFSTVRVVTMSEVLSGLKSTISRTFPGFLCGCIRRTVKLKFAPDVVRRRQASNTERSSTLRCRRLPRRRRRERRRNGFWSEHVTETDSPVDILGHAHHKTHVVSLEAGTLLQCNRGSVELEDHLVITSISLSPPLTRYLFTIDSPPLQTVQLQTVGPAYKDA
jgi:hypothetical protein